MTLFMLIGLPQGSLLWTLVLGFLAATFGLAAAMSASAAFWIPCGILLLVAAVVVGGDLRALEGRMAEVAREMRAERKA